VGPPKAAETSEPALSRRHSRHNSLRRAFARAGRNGWIAEQEALVEALVHNDEVPESPGLRGIAHTRRQARWLCGPEIDVQLEQLELGVRELLAKALCFS
jgi:hypothetical protein